MSDSVLTRARRVFVGFTIGCAIALTTIAAMEGTASGLLFVEDYRAAGPGALMRPHMVDDALLGWSNKPSFTSRDEYGKDIVFTTTSSRTRGTGAADTATATRRPRMVCSGDSYTMGYGVADDHHWCALVARAFGYRAINMGQLDYGLDQTLLWYRRNSVGSDIRLHVLGLTNQQLERMTTSNLGGRFKPTLAIDGDALVPVHVPVQRQSSEAMRRANAAHAKDELRFLQLLRTLPSLDTRQQEAGRIDGQWRLVDRTLAELSAIDRTRGARLVVAYLPTKRDLRPGNVDERRQLLAEYCHWHGITYIDLTAEMRDLRPDSLDLAFISRIPAGAAPGVANQYSNLGHLWVAQRISAHMSTGSLASR